MKKLIAILTLMLAACGDKNAQNNSAETDCQQKINNATAQRDSVQLLYNDVLGRLDSVTGSNINLYNLLKARDSEIVLLKKRSH